MVVKDLWVSCSHRLVALVGVLSRSKLNDVFRAFLLPYLRSVVEVTGAHENVVAE